MRQMTRHYAPTGAVTGVADDIRSGQVTVKNTSGIRGVCWVKTRKKWIAYIQVNKHQKVIGYFDSKEEAAKARAKAVKEIYE